MGNLYDQPGDPLNFGRDSFSKGRLPDSKEQDYEEGACRTVCTALQCESMSVVYLTGTYVLWFGHPGKQNTIGPIQKAMEILHAEVILTIATLCECP